MPSALIRAMLEKYAYPVLDEGSIDTFVKARDEVVLFFAENPRQFPESDDVAMILPELIKAYGGRLQAALIHRNAEHALQRRYGFATWPALVFLRRGEYLGVITQVRNWDDYLGEIDRLLASEPVRAPGFRIPVVGEPGHGCQPPV
jgi:hydrogenase-1 operon protein HyaE